MRKSAFLLLFAGLCAVACASRKEAEEASPGHYAVSLPDNGARIDITCTQRVACYEISYSGKERHLLINPQYIQLRNVRYIRGCNGNPQAIGRLLEGMNARDAMGLLSGINCNARGTSCTDQLARVLKAIDLTSCR